MASTDTDPLDALRERIFELMAQEQRPMHTSTLAGALGVLTHQVQTALHHPYQTGKVQFSSSEGWTLPRPPARQPDGQQDSLV
jgi:hypothetical protein